MLLFTNNNIYQFIIIIIKSVYLFNQIKIVDIITIISNQSNNFYISFILYFRLIYLLKKIICKKF